MIGFMHRLKSLVVLQLLAHCRTCLNFADFRAVSAQVYELYKDDASDGGRAWPVLRSELTSIRACFISTFYQKYELRNACAALQVIK